MESLLHETMASRCEIPCLEKVVWNKMEQAEGNQQTVSVCEYLFGRLTFAYDFQIKV